jgi:hypothetical protein
MGQGTVLRGLLDEAMELLNLTHYSQRKRALIDPERQFSGPLYGAEQELDAAGAYPAQSYWGVDVGRPGGYRSEFDVGTYRHETRLPAERFYDIGSDPMQLRKDAEAIVDAERAAEEMRMSDWYWENRAIGHQMQLAKDRGFIGLLSRDRPQGATATTFYPAKPLYVTKTTSEQELLGILDYLEKMR